MPSLDEAPVTSTGQQAGVVRTLAALLEQHPDTPAVFWRISPYALNRVEGQLDFFTPDPGAVEMSTEERRRAVGVWAGALTTEVEEREAPSGRFTRVSATGLYHGLAVTVWTHLGWDGPTEGAA